MQKKRKEKKEKIERNSPFALTTLTTPGADRFATTNFDRKRVATFPSFGRLLRFWFPSS